MLYSCSQRRSSKPSCCQCRNLYYYVCATGHGNMAYVYQRLREARKGVLLGLSSGQISKCLEIVNWLLSCVLLLRYISSCTTREYVNTMELVVDMSENELTVAGLGSMFWMTR